VSIAAGGDDLKRLGHHWSSEKVLFRPGEGPGMFWEASRIALPLGRSCGAGICAPHGSGGALQLNVTGATLVHQHHPAASARFMIPAAGLALDGFAHMRRSSGCRPDLRPLAMRVDDDRQGWRHTGAPALERDAAEAPWTPLAIASLKQGGAGATLDLHEGPARFLKLQADPRSGGFSQVPSVTFEYAPVALAVAFNGNGPYRLLVGNAAAKPSTFALSDLTSQTGPFATARIIGAQTGVTIMARDDATMSRTSPRVVALWVALLAGVAVLAYAAFRLLRANNAGAGDPG
jgi:hypothetical protein